MKRIDRSMWQAEETAAAFMPDADALEDRKQFVENLGWLLSQCRGHIVGAYLDDEEVVHIKHDHDFEIRVNVKMDSYMAILRDVMKRI